MRAVLVCALVWVCVAGVCFASPEWPQTEKKLISLSDTFKEQVAAKYRKLNPRDVSLTEVDAEVDDEAGLLFRKMDVDANNKLSSEDVRQSSAVLRQFFPGLSREDFVAFIDLADEDGDGELSKNEFLKYVKPVVEKLKQRPSVESFLETATSVTTDETFVRWGKKLMRKMSGRVDTSQDQCVMCQYIVERCERTVKMSGVIPGMSVMIEEDAKVTVTDEEESLLQTAQYPLHGGVELAGASAIANERAATRMQRQMERQKYNEIYRLTDVTLDDVCEQGMPHVFYGYCKYIYSVQNDVVDGLRYQFRPSDICFKINMCDRTSYITRGVHSRYKEMVKHRKKSLMEKMINSHPLGMLAQIGGH